MKDILPACIALGMAAAAPAHAAPAPVPCPGLAGSSSPIYAERSYADRALAIVRAGLRGDMAALDRFVARQAEFAIWRGDSSDSWRQTGAPGAIEMARDLNPTRFQIAVIQPGPVAAVATRCTWSTTILFRTPDEETGVTVTFAFADGLLVKAVGQQVALREGPVR